MESFTSLQRCLLSLAFHPSIKFCDTSKGSYHYRNDLYHFEFPQSSNLSLEVLVLFHFLPFFDPYSYVSWYSTGIPMIILFHSSLSIKIMSGLLASITLSHWTLISHNTFTSSFSTAPSGTCSYHFSVCLAHSSYKGPNWLSLLHCRVVSYILSEPLSHIHLLNVAHFHLFFPT